MSFETFIDNIENMAMMPALEKTDSGYAYDEKYYGNIYKFNNKLILISENAVDEMQIPLIEAVYNAIESGVAADVKEAIESMSQAKDHSEEIEEMKSDISSVVDDISAKASIDDVDRYLKTVVTELEDKIESSKSSISIETIQKMVDQKFNDAPARVGKIKISTLSMLKESGFSIEEIGELAKNNLI